MKTDTYRKLTEHELELFGISRTFAEQKSSAHDEYREFVKKYYNDTATLAEVVMNSEYNDEDYENSVQMVIVYDGDGDEIVPNKSTARECRNDMSSLGLPSGEYESREAKESFFVQLSPKFPDLYVKE